MRFVGRFEHSLDAKGRIILPARFRSSFGTNAFLSQHNEGCLALWTPDAFERKLDEMQAKQDLSSEDRTVVRAWAAGSAEVELDRQGRVAIPGHLRAFAHLENAVLVHGAITHIEIWNPEVWAERGAPGDAVLANPPWTPSGPPPTPTTSTGAGPATPSGAGLATSTGADPAAPPADPHP
jgi:MraZ protein